MLYNAKKGKQSHIFNTSKKTVTCLAFAADGKHLVTGEVQISQFGLDHSTYFKHSTSW